MSEDGPSKKKRNNLAIRQMEIDDLAHVFHLGEKLFTAREVPNLYRTWDEYEVVNLFQSDPEFCLVAEFDDEIVGFMKLFRYFQDLMLESGVRMLLTDTEAENLPALHFFRKMGFGHPQQHIYMTLNLSDQQRQLKEKKENGRTQQRRLNRNNG
jgi:ribosomal protein S18 acetylase RimI-like enzyme